MNSITASTQSPFSNLLLNDENYTATFNWPAPNTMTSSVIFFFPNMQLPSNMKVLAQLSTTQIINTTGSYVYTASLQHSDDGVTFTNIPIFNNALLSTTDSAGTASAASVQVFLPPRTVKQYVKAVVGSPSNQVNSTGSSSPSGSFMIEFEF